MPNSYRYDVRFASAIATPRSRSVRRFAPRASSRSAASRASRARRFCASRELMRTKVTDGTMYAGRVHGRALLLALALTLALPAAANAEEKLLTLYSPAIAT